jgi:CRISPR-associated endonuclease/helicase Cas3
LNYFTPLTKLVESRVALQKALEEFSRGRNIVLIAPTGYGKTILSLGLVNKARNHGISDGLIHVVPYRALVREIYVEKFKGNYQNTGYQSMDEIEPWDKSPYYLRELVVSTLDSFIYNLYKLPVSEMHKILRGVRTHGHYYPVLASIFTSTVVFDEAHIYLGAELASGSEDEVETLAFLMAALDFLAQMNIPLVVETATMHSDIIAEITEIIKHSSKDAITIYVGGENLQIKKLREKGVNVLSIRDKEFEEEHGFKWRTQLIIRESAIKMIKEICESEPILVIHNSIKRAIEAYMEISKKCGNIVLLHSLISNKDREEALRKIKDEISGRKGVIVSTQVVEAGVDIGVRILVSEPAPIENIAQRSGRLCREKFKNIFKACREEGAEIYIIKDDPRETAEVYNKERVSSTMELLEETVKDNYYAIDWRLLSTNTANTRSFTDILEKVPIKSPREVFYTPNYTLANAYLNSDGQPDALIKILDDLGRGIVRSSILVNVLIPPYIGINPDDWEFATVDFERIMRREKSTNNKCLEYIVEDNRFYPKILLLGLTDRGVDPVVSRTKLDLETINRVIHRGKFTIIIKSLSEVKEQVEKLKGVMGSFLIAKSDCYHRGMGLEIW